MPPTPPRLTEHYLDELEKRMDALEQNTADLPQLRAEVAKVSARPTTWLDTGKSVAQLVVAAATAAMLLKPLLFPAPAQADVEAVAQRAAAAAIEAMARQQSGAAGVKPAKLTTPQP